MNTLMKHWLPGAALAAALALTLFAPALVAAPESVARKLSEELQPWLQRDLGSEILRDADSLYRPDLSFSGAVSREVAVESRARALAQALQPWLHRDLRAEIRSEVEDQFQQKYGRIAVVDAVLPDNTICL